jgi:hypothetical protein
MWHDMPWPDRCQIYQKLLRIPIENFPKTLSYAQVRLGVDYVSWPNNPHVIIVVGTSLKIDLGIEFRQRHAESNLYQLSEKSIEKAYQGR